MPRINHIKGLTTARLPESWSEDLLATESVGEPPSEELIQEFQEVYTRYLPENIREGLAVYAVLLTFKDTQGERLLYRYIERVLDQDPTRNNDTSLFIAALELMSKAMYKGKVLPAPVAESFWALLTFAQRWALYRALRGRWQAQYFVGADIITLHMKPSLKGRFLMYL